MATFIKQYNIIRLVLVTALIMLAPVIGSLTMEGWDWSSSDFVFAASFIFGTGLAYELISKKMTASSYKFAVGVALVSTFLLVWVSLAVGIIGSEDNSANLGYFIAVLLGVVGAAASRLKPLGMSYTLFGMAAVVEATPIVALIRNSPDFSPGVLGVLGITTFFAALYVVSGLLFRSASGSNA